MMDKLGKQISIADKQLGDFSAVCRQHGKGGFFLLENTIYVIKDEFIHPGGQFILPRIDRGHITKYYFGIAPLNNMPYPNMVYLHNAPIPNEICKEKVTLAMDPIWVEKHPNLVLTTPSWKKDFSWRVTKILQLSKVHVLFYVRPKNVAIETEELKKAVSSFGKILLCHFKHQNDFKCSFLHLSSYNAFVKNQKRFYHTILSKAPFQIFQKVTNRSEGILINWNKKKGTDYVQSDIQNKFAQKYANEIFDSVVESTEYQDYLPIILKLKDRRKFFDGLSREEAHQIKTNFLKKNDQPVEIKSKIKMAIGGPFGWENILENDREIVLFLDSDGIYAMDDPAYALLQSMHVLLSGQEPEDRQKHERNLNIRLHIIFKTTKDKMDSLSEFLVAFYFYEKIVKKNFLKSMFVYTNENLLHNYIRDNSYSLATAHRHIIAAKYKNGYDYFKQIKKLVDKNNILFI